MSGGTELADQGLVSFLQRIVPDLRLPSRGDLSVTVTLRSSQESPCLAVPSIKVPRPPHPTPAPGKNRERETSGSVSGLESGGVTRVLMRGLAHELVLPSSVYPEFTRECYLCIWGLSACKVLWVLPVLLFLGLSDVGDGGLRWEWLF